MLKVMPPAILVGGLGVFWLVGAGDARYYVEGADLLAVGLGAAMFGVALTLLGYRPDTAIAAMGAGSLNAVVGLAGMVFGAIVYAFSFDWVKVHGLSVWAFGKVRIPDLTGVQYLQCFAGLAVFAVLLFAVVEWRQRGACAFRPEKAARKGTDEAMYRGRRSRVCYCGRRLSRACAAAPSAAMLEPAPMDQATVERGAYLVRIGDCAACHSAEGGKPMTVGLASPRRWESSTRPAAASLRMAAFSIPRCLTLRSQKSPTTT